MATDVTITTKSAPMLVIAHLHHPDNATQPTPLQFNATENVKALPDGRYDLQLAGTVLPKEAPIEVKIATAANALDLGIRTDPDGRIGAYVPFFLFNGKVE